MNQDKPARVWRLIARFGSPRALHLAAEPLFTWAGRRDLPSRIDLARVRRLLVIRTDEIGDLILTTPLLRELRRNLPQAQITLVVKPLTRELVEYCPHINEILTFDRQVALATWPFDQFARHLRALRLAAAKLWPGHYDLALVPRWDIDHYHASVLAYLSGAPYRVGYSRHVCPTKFQLADGLDRLFTHLLHDALPKHEVLHNLDVLHFLGGRAEADGLELFLGQDDYRFAAEFLAAHRLDPQRELLVGLCPGAGHAKRMWPAERFAAVASWLIEAYQARILLLGACADHRLLAEIQYRLDNRALTCSPVPTLRQTAALLARCHGYLGNDSGPTHLAAAMGTPTVEVSCHPATGAAWHSNSPVRFGPWGVVHRVVQPGGAAFPCSEGCDAPEAHCILAVTVQEVREAVASVLAECAAGWVGQTTRLRNSWR